MSNNSQRERAMKVFSTNSVLRPQDLAEAGVSRTTLQRMVAEGMIERIARGMYMNPHSDLTPHHSLVEVQTQVPDGVVCLLSALRYHEIGTQAPRRIWIAVPRGHWIPAVTSPPVRIVSFTGAAYSEGIIEVEIEGTAVRVYGVAKTVADCFKYRNRIGTSIAVEALKDALSQKTATPDELLRYGEVCRVRQIMIPYLEILV
jgi:predicted transcriptional regulator of viral defense system